jgi:hypothetical protein
MLIILDACIISIKHVLSANLKISGRNIHLSALFVKYNHVKCIRIQGADGKAESGGA